MKAVPLTVNGKQLQGQEGQNLLDFLLQEKVFVVSPCGGGKCKKCSVILNGKKVLSCQVNLHEGDIVLAESKENILSNSGITQTKRHFSEKGTFAVDIGTTTVAVALLGVDGGVTEVVTFPNPQRQFGADIVTRIQTATKVGVNRLQQGLLDKLSEVFVSLEKKYGCSCDKVYVSGNTTMLHLFWGEEVASLAVYPYTPRFLTERKGVINGKTYITLPCISTYVGSDIVSGISVCPMPPTGKYNFLVDLGTNCETALFSDKEILVTATSAGPCFEAGNISCGMPATDGAVYAFHLTTEGKQEFSYFGDKPEGVCGSGLFDIVSSLLKNNIIDKSGYLKYENGYPIGQNILFLQQDVREFQTAKSAVRSGMEILMRKARINAEQIQNVFLAGGFCSEKIVEDITACGVFPPSLSDKIIPSYNTSLRGAIRYSHKKNDLQEICNKATFVDLNCEKDFFDNFIKYINF